MQIDKVRVQNFKSIQDSGWVSLEDDLTALVGENEAGKSNFLEALSYIGKEGKVPLEHLCKESVDDRWNVDRSEHKFISVKLSPGLPHAGIFSEELKIGDDYVIKIDFSLSHYLSKMCSDSTYVKKYPIEFLFEKSKKDKELEKYNLINESKTVLDSFKNNRSKKEKIESIKMFLDRSFRKMEKLEYIDKIQQSEIFNGMKQTEYLLRESANSDFLLTEFEKQILPKMNIRKKFKLIEDSSSVTVKKLALRTST